MASDICKVVIIGRLTRDQELTYTQGGFPIGKMSIAVNRSEKKGDSYQDYASFFDVTFLGKRAEKLNQYLVRGTRIAVDGELKQERWEKDGQKRSKTVVIVDTIQLLGGKKSGGQQDQPSYSQPGNDQRFEDDIPF